jgi:hypothetical protein
MGGAERATKSCVRMAEGVLDGLGGWRSLAADPWLGCPASQPRIWLVLPSFCCRITKERVCGSTHSEPSEFQRNDGDRFVSRSSSNVVADPRIASRNRAADHPRPAAAIALRLTWFSRPGRPGAVMFWNDFISSDNSLSWEVVG